MKQRLSKIFNFILIFGTLAVVLLIGLQSDDVGNSIMALRSMGMVWIALATLSYLFFGAADALSLWFFLRRRKVRVSFGYMLFVANAGLYYSNITPGASGGQPMQIYYLHKQGVPIGLASSALVVRFFSFQAMLSVIATAFWISHSGFIAQQLGGHMWIFIVGYVYNLILVLGLVLVAMNKNIVRFFISLFIQLGVKLRLVKDAQASRQKWEDALTSFHDSILMMRDHPAELVLQLVIGGVQLMALMSVLYFVYLGLGLRGATYGQLMALDVVQYVSAAYIPTPGASGAQEVSFSMYFGELFTDGTRFAALILWRFFTYYLSLIIGAVLTVLYGLRAGRKSRTVTRPPDSSGK